MKQAFDGETHYWYNDSRERQQKSRVTQGNDTRTCDCTNLAQKILETVEDERSDSAEIYNGAVDDILIALRDLFRREGIEPKPLD